MLVPMFMGPFVSGYSSMAQQMSEYELLHSPAAIVVRTAAFVCGASFILFAIALWTAALKQYKFTAFAALLFGVSMISNAVFIMGGPMHGLYGIGIFVVLAPACFAAEFDDADGSHTVANWSMACAVYNLLYLWLMIARLDPSGYVGLTQRISCIPFYGWYCYASFVLLRADARYRLVR